MKTRIIALLCTLFISVSVFSQKNDVSLKVLTCKVGMHCHSCKDKIEKNIAFEKGVKDLDVDLEKQTVVVTYKTDKTSVQQLTDAIAKLGYSVEVISDEELKK